MCIYGFKFSLRKNGPEGPGQSNLNKRFLSQQKKVGVRNGRKGMMRIRAKINQQRQKINKAKDGTLKDQ